MNKKEIPLKDIKETLDVLVLAEKYIPKGEASGFKVVASITGRGEHTILQCYRSYLKLPDNHKLKKKYPLEKMEVGYTAVRSIGQHRCSAHEVKFFILVQYMGMG